MAEEKEGPATSRRGGGAAAGGPMAGAGGSGSEPHPRAGDSDTPDAYVDFTIDDMPDDANYKKLVRRKEYGNVPMHALIASLNMLTQEELERFGAYVTAQNEGDSSYIEAATAGNIDDLAKFVIGKSKIKFASLVAVNGEKVLLEYKNKVGDSAAYAKGSFAHVKKGFYPASNEAVAVRYEALDRSIEAHQRHARKASVAAAQGKADARHQENFHIHERAGSGAQYGVTLQPFYEGGELHAQAAIETGKISLPTVGLDHMYDILEQVLFMHDNGVTHCDMKLENIMLHNGRPVIVDLGLADAANASGTMNQAKGTPGWLTPHNAAFYEKNPAARRDTFFELNANTDLYPILVMLAMARPEFECSHPGDEQPFVIKQVVTPLPPDVKPLFDILHRTRDVDCNDAKARLAAANDTTALLKALPDLRRAMHKRLSEDLTAAATKAGDPDFGVATLQAAIPTVDAAAEPPSYEQLVSWKKSLSTVKQLQHWQAGMAFHQAQVTAQDNKPVMAAHLDAFNQAADAAQSALNKLSADSPASELADVQKVYQALCERRMQMETCMALHKAAVDYEKELAAPTPVGAAAAAGSGGSSHEEAHPHKPAGNALDVIAAEQQRLKNEAASIKRDLCESAKALTAPDADLSAASAAYLEAQNNLRTIEQAQTGLKKLSEKVTTLIITEWEKANLADHDADKFAHMTPSGREINTSMQKAQETCLAKLRKPGADIAEITQAANQLRCIQATRVSGCNPLSTIKTLHEAIALAEENVALCKSIGLSSDSVVTCLTDLISNLGMLTAFDVTAPEIQKAYGGNIMRDVEATHTTLKQRATLLAIANACRTAIDTLDPPSSFPPKKAGNDSARKQQQAHYLRDIVDQLQRIAKDPAPPERAMTEVEHLLNRAVIVLRHNPGMLSRGAPKVFDTFVSALDIMQPGDNSYRPSHTSQTQDKALMGILCRALTTKAKRGWARQTGTTLAVGTNDKGATIQCIKYDELCKKMTAGPKLKRDDMPAPDKGQAAAAGKGGV